METWQASQLQAPRQLRASQDELPSNPQVPQGAQRLEPSQDQPQAHALPGPVVQHPQEQRAERQQQASHPLQTQPAPQRRASPPASWRP